MAAREQVDIPKDWFEANNVYGAIATLRLLGIPLILTGVAPWAATSVSPWTLLVLLPLLGGAIHKLTILAHECSHFTLFDRRHWNDWVGGVACLLLGTSFQAFTRIHWVHHRNLGQPDEPQAVDYVGKRGWSRGALLWHLVQPLVGQSLFKVLQFNGLVTRRGGGGGIADGQTRLKVGRLVLIGVVQIGLAVLATGFGRVWWLFPLYPLAAGTVALFFSRWRSFAEHTADVDSDREAFIRSHEPNLFDRLFMFDLNFNYHVEHHAYPSLPAYRLAAAHALFLGHYQPGEEVSSGTIATVGRRLSLCGGGSQ